MADKKTETKSAPTPAKGSRSSGGRKAAKKRQELRRCRKALRHHQKRKWNTEALEQHMRSVEAGTPSVPNDGRRQRRIAQETREKAKRDAKAVREGRDTAQAAPSV